MGYMFHRYASEVLFSSSNVVYCMIRMHCSSVKNSQKRCLNCMLERSGARNISFHFIHFNSKFCLHLCPSVPFLFALFFLERREGQSYFCSIFAGAPTRLLRGNNGSVLA